MDISRWVEQRLGGPLIRLHTAVYEGTNGRLGHRIPGAAPMLLLHTVGARSGEPRTSSLTYARDGQAYVIVASKGGSPTSPAWYYNLRSTPHAEINVGPARLAVDAKLLLPDDPDYLRLWRLVNDNNAHRYDAYQRRTSRPIPIVVLTRRS
jgi:deazaflavin-dependent oxidoreductase (nitroreductase family)